MDNPWIESFWSHLKTENLSLLIEAKTLEELQEVIGKAISYYNEKRRHASLGNQAQMKYLEMERIIPAVPSAA